MPSQPRHAFELRDDVRIPVRDGLELSANLWLPLPHPDAPAERFPAVLEMIPYGKDNWRRNADTARGEWLASVAERAPGVASVATPVRDGYRVVAAVSVSGPVDRVTKRPGQRFGDQVVAAAREIEAAVAHGL